MRTTRSITVARAIVAATLYWVTSCSRVPNLTPHVAYIHIPDQVTQATLIVVGLVESEHLVRRIYSGPKESPDSLELRAVRIRVEGVLYGKSHEQHLTFYFYQVTGAWDGPEPNMITQEDRGIFYLVKDGEVWRAPTDAYASHTDLVTGKHRISLASNKDQVRDTIAQLLLLPGEGVNVDRFLGSLDRNEALAMDLVGKMQVVQLLRRLLQNPSPQIRLGGCITLAQFPLMEKDCVPRVLHELQTVPEDRK